MVKLTLPLAVLAMASVVAAAPSQQSPKVFSFQAWVEDIIANPNTALTVDEAIAAAQTADVVGSAGGLRRRIDCRDHLPDEPRANVSERLCFSSQVARLSRRLIEMSRQEMQPPVSTTLRARAAMELTALYPTLPFSSAELGTRKYGGALLQRGNQQTGRSERGGKHAFLTYQDTNTASL